MMSRILSLAIVALLALPPIVFAQPRSASDPAVVEVPAASPGSGTDSGSSTGVQLEKRRTRHVVLPRPPMERVIQDTEAAREEVRATARQDALIRQSRERPISRPELDYSITNGIQAQNVLKALRH